MSQLYVSTAKKRVTISFQQQGVAASSSPIAVRLAQPKLKVVSVARQGIPGIQGNSGIQGIQGVPGLDGALGSDLRYTHIQDTPATVWIVIHNLGKYPSPSAVDSAGTGVDGKMEHNSINQLTYTFSVPFSGRVFCN